jgi:hypothetical protein
MGPAVSPLHVLLLLLIGGIFIAAVVAFVLLLANPKTRVVTFALLGVAGVAVVLLVGGALFFRASNVVSPPAHWRQQVQSRPSNGSNGELAKQYETVMESYMGQGTPQPAPDYPTSPPTPTGKKSSPPAEAAPKDEDDLSQAVATKTVGMLRAMARALGRALVEEEKMLATKKDGTQPAAAPKVAKPDWVEAPPKLLAGESYQMSIVVGPYTTRAECEAKLSDALQEALDGYVEMAIGPEAVGMVQMPAEILRQEVYKASWEETRPFSVGPMIRLHGRLQFDRPFKARVQEAYREAIVAERLRAIGVWAALGLSLLTVSFAYLKVDLATGGTQRGRLRLGAAAVILMGLIAAAVAVVV